MARLLLQLMLLHRTGKKATRTLIEFQSPWSCFVYFFDHGNEKEYDRKEKNGKIQNLKLET
jgi:hypothetical protein